MGSVGILSEGAWTTFHGMCSEEGDIISHLLGESSFQSEHEHDGIMCFGNTSNFLSSHDFTMNMIGGNNEGSYYHDSETLNGNAFHFPQGSSSYSSDSSFYLPSLGCGSYYLDESNPVLVNNISPISMNFYMVPEDATSPSTKCCDDNLIDAVVCKNVEVSGSCFRKSGGFTQEPLPFPVQKPQKKRKSEMPEGDTVPEEKCYFTLSKNSNEPRSKKKKQNLVSSSCRKVDQEDPNGGGGFSGPSSSSGSSEEDSNASQEPNGGGATSSSKTSSALNLNGKERASRGSATDPQSLYARKRRERINERLRILQNLVPNGTKVDISTMLEEAVEYVMFLQLQIKLLSSDEHWMYAPLAYNGMNIGLDLEIPRLE